MHFSPDEYIEAVKNVEYLGAIIFENIKILKNHYGLPTRTKHVIFKYPNGDLQLVDITHVNFEGEKYHHVGNNYYEKTSVKESQYVDFVEYPINYN